MAIAHRATSSAVATVDTADGVSPAVPTGTTDGDLLLAWVSTGLLKTITPPAGWTTLGTFTFSIGGVSAWLGWKIASGESGSYAFTWTDSRGTGIVSAYSGVDTTNPIFCWRPISSDVTASPAGLTHAVGALSPLCTDPAVAMLVTFLSHARGTGTITDPSGYTRPTNGAADTGGTGDTSVKSATAYLAYTGGSGIGATSWTTGEAQKSVTIHLALREAGDTQATVSAWPGLPTTGLTTSLPLAMPLSIMTGDLLVCVAAWRGDGNVASISGWTQKGATISNVQSGDNLNLATFYKYATSPSESGTITLTASKPIAVTTFPIKRAGLSGDPFGDYQTVDDTSSNTTSDFPALTVAAQDMLDIACVSRRPDHAPTGVTSPYAAWANPTTTTPLYARLSASSADAMVCVAVNFQNTANPAAGNFTHGFSDVSVGAQGAIAIGTAPGGARSFAVMVG